MPDLADKAQHCEALELRAAISQVLHQQRWDTQIMDANGRVVCLDCGEPIPFRRLEVMPDCARCVDCQQAYEAEA